METAALAHPRLKSNSSFQIMHRFFYDTEPNTAALDRPVPSMSAALKKRFKNPHLILFSNSRPLVLNTQRQAVLIPAPAHFYHRARGREMKRVGQEVGENHFQQLGIGNDGLWSAFKIPMHMMCRTLLIQKANEPLTHVHDDYRRLLEVQVMGNLDVIM